MLPPFSIVIPCFNEEGRVGETLRVTIEYLAANTPESELIVVNDGSTDQSWQRLEQWALANPMVKAVNLSRNFGHQAAVCAGLDAAWWFFGAMARVLLPDNMSAMVQRADELGPTLVAP